MCVRVCRVTCSHRPAETAPVAQPQQTSCVSTNTHRHWAGPGASETRWRCLAEAASRLRPAAQAASLQRRSGAAACLEHRGPLGRPLEAAADPQPPEEAAFRRQAAGAALHAEVAERRIRKAQLGPCGNHKAKKPGSDIGLRTVAHAHCRSRGPKSKIRVGMSASKRAVSQTCTRRLRRRRATLGGTSTRCELSTRKNRDDRKVEQAKSAIFGAVKVAKPRPNTSQPTDGHTMSNSRGGGIMEAPGGPGTPLGGPACISQPGKCGNHE